MQVDDHSLIEEEKTEETEEGAIISASFLSQIYFKFLYVSKGSILLTDLGIGLFSVVSLASHHQYFENISKGFSVELKAIKCTFS